MAGKEFNAGVSQCKRIERSSLPVNLTSSLALLAAGGCFGATFVLGKLAKSPRAGGLGAEEAAVFRFLFALLVIPLISNRSNFYLKGHNVFGLTLRGLLGFGAAYLSLKAVMHPSSSTETGIASVLNSTSIAFAPLFAWMFLGEKVALRSWIAVAITMVGVILLEVRHSFSAGIGVPPASELYALGSGILAGMVIVVLRGLRSGSSPERPEVIVFYYALVATIGSLIVFAINGTWHRPTAFGVLLLLLLGLANLGAQWLMSFGLQMTNTVAGALMLNCQSVIVAFLGWVIFQETYSASAIFAASVIIGVAVWLSSPIKRSVNNPAG